MENNYETMIILKYDLSDNEREDVSQKLAKKIEELSGSVLSSKIWAKERNFYYPLRSRGAEKKKYNKGSYLLLDFKLDSNKLSDLKETVRLEERILRNLIIKR